MSLYRLTQYLPFTKSLDELNYLKYLDFKRCCTAYLLGICRDSIHYEWPVCYTGSWWSLFRRNTYRPHLFCIFSFHVCWCHRQTFQISHGISLRMRLHSFDNPFFVHLHRTVLSLQRVGLKIQKTCI